MKRMIKTIIIIIIILICILFLPTSIEKPWKECKINEHCTCYTVYSPVLWLNGKIYWNSCNAHCKCQSYFWKTILKKYIIKNNP